MTTTRNFDAGLTVNGSFIYVVLPLIGFPEVPGSPL